MIDLTPIPNMAAADRGTSIELKYTKGSVLVETATALEEVYQRIDKRHNGILVSLYTPERSIGVAISADEAEAIASALLVQAEWLRKQYPNDD